MALISCAPIRPGSKVSQCNMKLWRGPSNLLPIHLSTAVKLRPSCHREQRFLHLTTLRNDNICNRLALASYARVLNLTHHVHPVNDLAEDDVLPIQERSGNLADISRQSMLVGETSLLW